MTTLAAAAAAARAAPSGRTSRTLALLWLLLHRELRFSGLLLGRELRELLTSRALWAMVGISAPLVGFSFIQAVQLYAGASQNAARLPQLSANLSPLDGIVVPTFGAVYLMNTFLLPFVAIRVIGNEKQTGSLKLLLQLPIGPYRLVGIKLAALGVGWLLALLPTLSALLIWVVVLGGHLYLPELLSVLLGHALDALVIAGFAFLAAALTDSSATAAIVTLSFTLGSWILEFAGTTSSGPIRAIAAFSLTPALRGLERGLLGSPTALTLLVLGFGFLALTVVWLPTGVSRRQKLLRSGFVLGLAAQALLLVIQLPLYVDASEDRRNSFNPADERALHAMPKELRINVNLSANDSRLRDLDRNVLSKLQRVMPHVTITYAETSPSSLLGGASAQNYGVVTYTYGGKQGISRATTAREVLPLIEKLAGQTVGPEPRAAYPGYPLAASASGAAIWFYGLLPLLAVAGWWLSRQPPALVAGHPAAARWLWIKPDRLPPWLGPLAPYLPTARRIGLLAGAALLLIQVVPYGREHASLSVAPAPQPYVQACRASAATGQTSQMSLGQLNAQLAAMDTGLSDALAALASGNVATARAAYGRFALAYGGGAAEIAYLYPGRCPRLNADRLAVDGVLAAPVLDQSTAPLPLRALTAGVASLRTDLGARVRQQSPNDPVAEQAPERDAPSVTGEPPFDPRTRDLAARACSACHSNQPGWGWYTNLAPLSWLVQRQVDLGRAALNFSEWDRVQPAAAVAAQVVQARRMPPAWASVLDGRFQLSDADRDDLVRGLSAE